MKQQKNEMFQTSKDKVFAFIKNEKGKIVICLGGYQASKKTFDTFKQAQEYVNTKPYELLINICGIILYKQNENIEKENAETTEGGEAN